MNVSLCVQPIGVDTDTAARLLGMSVSMFRLHVRRGDITPRFSGTKPLFALEDLRTFFSNLPTRGRAL
ncbi:hypothetical protein ACFQ9V_00740 [Leifsonia sp. NPDC056665]|uniref:hypothetical protein n=1 Tax=Leifsonia sp. NPDC056665 TaxID=3345901 RepID=UPI0036BBBE39